MEPESKTKRKRHRAVFTIVRDEPVFLPIWLGYYSKYFEPKDIYILDNDTADGSTDDLGNRARVLRRHNEEYFDHVWLVNTVSNFQKLLFERYHNVLFAEVDEIVMADPKHVDGLDTYIRNFSIDHVRCSGYELVHDRREEPPLDFNKGILAQRKYFYPYKIMCKPLLGKAPYIWKAGFHSAKNNIAYPIDQRLLLIHLHRVDYDYCLERHIQRSYYKWSQKNQDPVKSQQNKLTKTKEFNQWFFDLIKQGDRHIIPERLKDLV